MKSVLVTGAAGFIGARFVRSCNQRGVPVISVDREKYFTERKFEAKVNFGRIVDRDRLFDWLAKEKPELSSIVHMGACSATTQLDEEFLRRNNVEYSQKVWNYACERKLTLVYASSAATYGGGELGYEDDEALIPRLKPLNPYGESKRLFDLWALEQEKRGHEPPAWSGFKFFNVYGPFERHKGSQASVVRHAIDQIEASGVVKLFKSHNPKYRDGEQLRDFISVDDVVEVLHFARTRPLSRGIYNLGTGKARTFLDLVNATFKAMGKTPQIEFIDTPEKIRDRYQYFTEAKMDKLRRKGYTAPFLSLEEGVRRYVEEWRVSKKG